MSGRPAPHPPPPVCPKVCIFDIDATVTMGPKHSPNACRAISGPPPAWPDKGSGTTAVVKDAIKQCIDNGYKIAFASAESQTEEDNARQRAFIASLAPNEEFDSKFFDSPAVQSSWKVLAHTPADRKLEFAHKQAMILNIMQHYRVEPACFEQSILFDDEVSNLADARALGLKVAQASPECGGSYCDRACGLPASALSVIV